MKNSIKKNSIHKSQFTRRTINLENFKDRLDFNLNHGVCGSVNLGNTCFMNSSIACLSNCSELTSYFLEKTFENDINKKNVDGSQGHLAIEWYNLLCDYWLSNESYGNPKKIKNIVGSKNRKFLGYSQQDSNEFMTVFLEILGEDLNRTTKKKYIELKEQQKYENDIMAAERFWNLHIQRNDSIVTDLFHGLLKSIIICPRCGFNNITYDPFNTLTLTIPDAYKISQLEQKRTKIITKTIKKEKEKENVNIYYVSPFSLIQTKKFDIEVYKGLTLNEIIKQIQKRGDKKISTNLKYMAVANKECEKFIDGKKPKVNEYFIFAYEKEEKRDSHYCIPIYLCDNNKISAYPRALFFNKNTSYSDFKKKIYILVRKYLKHPFSEPTKEEEFEEDKELRKYMQGNSSLNKVCSLLGKEFDLLEKNYSNLKEYNKNPPYKIYISKKLNNIKTKDNYLINEGNRDNAELLSDFGITTKNSNIDNLLETINDTKNNKLYLIVKINNKSPFANKENNFDTCNVEKCTELNEKEYETKEEQMEIEDDDEDNNYSNNGNITLDHCLQYFTDEECLEEGNEWYCNRCKRRVMATKKIELFYLPRIMCICLSRFLKRGKFYNYSKNNSFVEFPIENLNMEKYICGPDKEYSKYDLFAVSQHYGGMGGGHYTAVCKNIDGNWYEYDDMHCSPISPKKVCTSAAYVLFYRRKNW